MLGKALLTLLVVLAAFLVVRHRNESETDSRPRRAAPAEEGASSSSDLRFAAYLFLILMVGTGTFIYVQRWQDDHTVLTVNLYRSEQAAPVSFQVYKYQLESRSFTTLDGVRITVADNERMEILGLE